VSFHRRSSPPSLLEPSADHNTNRLNAVSRFLAGGGLEEAKTSESPYIFCEDSFATYANPQQPMLDSRGNSIPVKDKDGNVVGYKTIEELFPFWDFSASTPFWVGHFQAYLFDSNGFPTLYGRPTLQAATKTTPRIPDGSDPDITYGIFDPFIVLCPPSFEATDGAHSANALNDALTYDGYPTAGVGPQLDKYAPYSAT